MNLPNAISILRFPLAALFPVVTGLPGRIAIVAVAAFTDFLDGRLARSTGTVTRTGELLDPIADKTFMVAAIVTLVAEGRLALWTLPLLLVRDIGVALGAAVLALRGTRVRMPARRAGKIVTWAQFAAIGVILLRPLTAVWVAPAIALAGAVALRDYVLAVLPAVRAAQTRTTSRAP